MTYGQPYVEMPRRNDAHTLMPDQPPYKKPETEVPRVKLTARVTLDAYDAITEIQRRHRRKTGRALRLWEVVDAAIVAYAKRRGIKAGG